MMLFKTTVIFGFFAVFCQFCGAVESHDEYQANSYQEYQKYSGILKNEWLKGVWIKDQFLYEWESGEGKDRKKHYYFSTPDGERKLAFNQEALALKMAKITKKMVTSDNLPIGKLILKNETLMMQVGNLWHDWDWEKQELTASKRDKQNRKDWSLSPDGKWKVHVDGAKLSLEEVGVETKLLLEGDPKTQGFRDIVWAPDSKKFVIGKVTKGQRRQVKFIESAPKDQLQPKLHEFWYDKPGDKIDVSEPEVFFTDERESFAADESLLENTYMVYGYKWRDNHTFTYHYVERGFGKHHVIITDIEKREHRVLIREESDTYVFVNDSYRYDVDGGKEIIWKSERDGWNHLYLYDGVSGEVKNQITKGEMTVHEVVYVDEKARKILFTAGGEVDGRDPYYVHYYWVNFDGSGLTRITRGMDNHKLDFSADYRYAVDKVCGMDRTPSYQMIDGATGKVLSQLGMCDSSELKAKGWTMPESFKSTDRDGEFEIWGTIHRPVNFDPNKQYPVIEHIYAGPHDQHVPKDFRFWYPGIHELTMRGFIVVQIDGKGTNKRCKEFSHFSYKNLVDAGFPDRIKWIKEAAKKYPYMDVARVGIFGGSAGGQNSTGAVLHHGDFYKAAFSDCGCHDNRMDKIWWNEQWMDWPVGPHYAEQSNVTNAHKLTGKLFLCVGELDRNVDPASTMQLADALVKAGKEFDLLVMPGKGHGCAESVYGRWRRAKFFTEHLGQPVER